MAHPTKKINMNWSGSLAYTIGIIASDGYLSSNRRHISITSKDKEILEYCRASLEIDNTIGVKSRKKGLEKKYFVLQFGSVLFYTFLESLGITTNKSLTITHVEVPDLYYADFFRGLIDGDGSISTHKHPESVHPQLKIRLASASLPFLVFVMQKNKSLLQISGGWIYSDKRKNIHQLTYGKKDSIQLLKLMYNTQCNFKLDRKYEIARPFIT